jgi:hypothetical protein
MGEQSGDWVYSVSNGQATITGYTGAGGAVSIPNFLNSYPVVRIGSNAFSGSALISVNFPDSVTSIGDYAFQGCASLISVSIPNSVWYIGDYAFASCSSLISVSIPNSVTTIGGYAFAGCISLGSVIIPNSVANIGELAFSRSGLGSVFLSPNLSSSQITITNAGFPSTAVFYVGSTTPTAMATQADLATTQAQLATTQAQLASTQTQLATTQAELAVIKAQLETLPVALTDSLAFVNAVANKIKGQEGNFGIATQSGLSSAITTAVEPLATKTELTSSLAQSRTDGINSVLSNPNLWTLYTTSQIQNMAVGDLVLTRQVSGGFVLNYDIEQSTDLQTWTPYQALSLPLTGLPTDKAFVRIKAKQ